MRKRSDYDSPWKETMLIDWGKMSGEIGDSPWMKNNLVWLALLFVVVVCLAPLGVWRKTDPPPAPLAATPNPDSGLQLDFAKGGPVQILQQNPGSALLKVDMSQHKRLRLTARFAAPLSGWALTVGDSDTNNGYGGDASTQYWDAEAEVLNGDLNVYGSDLLADAPRKLKSFPKVAAPGQELTMEIADGFISYSSPSGSGELRHKALFALAGQAEPNQGQTNYDLYVGANRVVQGDRHGTGLTYLKLECSN